MEMITIKITRSNFDALIGAGALSSYEIKSVTVSGEDFTGDEVYKSLKKSADDSYKKLETYKFNKRFNIKKQR